MSLSAEEQSILADYYKGKVSTLSRRDHFAMAAMQGLLATNEETYRWVPGIAVRLADALIEELDGGGE